MPALFRNRGFWIAILAVLTLFVGGVFLSRQANAKKAEQKKAEAAKLATPSPYAAIADGKADVEGGIIQVAARTAGVIRSVDVQEGDSVRKGQVLAQIEDDQPKLNVANARAAEAQAQSQIQLLQVQKETAQREYDRLLPLKAKQFIAGQSLDKAQDSIREADAQIDAQRAAVETAQAAYNTAQYTLELTKVRAPADGKIVRRYANPGSGASTLQVSNMFDLVPDTRRIVRAEIVESDVPHIFAGQDVEVSPEADPTKMYVGKVLRRSDEFGARKLQSDDPTERTDERVVEVVVSADNTNLLVGQRVLVKFLRPGQQAGVVHGAPKVAPVKVATRKTA
ncbi:MAG: efflux RND transporter periplasmic adaptor subunit [Caulobacteraceae bacterium]